MLAALRRRARAAVLTAAVTLGLLQLIVPALVDAVITAVLIGMLAATTPERNRKD